MKKLILFLFFFSGSFFFSQKKQEPKIKYTLEQAQKSEDSKVLANFIINHPNHPETPKLKNKLAYLELSKINAYEKKASATPAKTNNKKKNETVDMLNYLLNDNKKSNQAFIFVKNLSKCDIRIDFKGKNNYLLDIKANSVGRILLNKGRYDISSTICAAKYTSTKNITHDIQINLGNK